MPRILIRSHKNPFTVADAETTHARNLIGNNTGNLVFSQAVYRLLSTPDAELETSKLAGSKARGVNSRFDHVVIPLANAFADVPLYDNEPKTFREKYGRTQSAGRPLYQYVIDLTREFMGHAGR